jgi:amino acid transporter
MQLVAWPMSGIFSMFLTLTLSELASAYPVAGAMASWAWKCARGGVGGERKWGWLLGGIVLAGHAAAVRHSLSCSPRFCTYANPY